MDNIMTYCALEEEKRFKELTELVQLGEIEMVVELMEAHLQEYIDAMPNYEKIYWHYVESTHQDWIEARILYFKMRHGIDITK